MSSTTISPNMSMPVPTVGIDTGPDWANNLNSCLSILDQHNHSSGSGVPIQPAGLNINSALSFQNQAATNLSSAVFTAQSSLATLNAAYVKGVDLYFNDGSGNVIQITTGGTVNATSSGISSGTATASFVSSVLVVNAASTTPANIQCGSVLLGNNTAGSHFLTIAPPNAMGADYSLTMPIIPAIKSIMALDTSGNLSGAYTVDGTTITIAGTIIGVPNGGIATAQLGSSSVTTAKIADANVTKAKSAADGYAISSTSTGSFSSSSGALTDVTNATVSNTVSGQQLVLMKLVSDGSAGYVQVDCTSGGDAEAELAFVVGGVVVSLQRIESYSNPGTAQKIRVPLSSCSHLFSLSNGTYTFKAQVRVITGGTTTISVINAKLAVTEI